jgi:hypothetical protein
MITRGEKTFICIFSLIRLVPNFYGMYIIYSQKKIIKKNLFIYFYNPKFKKLSNGYDCFWYMLVWLHSQPDMQLLPLG